jgi:hypothetical protein
LSEAPETIPGPSTFNQDLGRFLRLKCGSFTVPGDLTDLLYQAE